VRHAEAAVTRRESPRWIVVALVTFATFTDILAYSIAVPVLPDISRRYGASPTLVGLLFASFGLTVLLTSVPMGAASDRTGRRAPLVGGTLALSAASVVFAFAPDMRWLFAARLIQGVADAVTWVVGFAVVADLYDADERGRVMGLVMSGTTVAFMIGPTLGGWLYEIGGPRVPYLVVAGLALIASAGLFAAALPPRTAARETVPFFRLLRVPAVATCAAAVVVGGGTIAMIEPVLALHLESALDLGPGRVGMVFGAGAVTTALLHPLFGRTADRTGGRRLTLVGLALVGATLPVLTQIGGFLSAIVLNAVFAVTVSVLVTPSLAYMAEATGSTGVRSFGVSYGIYNVAWALGLLAGPSLGGFLYERIGLPALLVVWSAGVLAVAAALWRQAPAGSSAAV
jgi:multidrug resistance protein